MKRFHVEKSIFSEDEQEEMRRLAVQSEIFRQQGKKFERICYSLKIGMIAVENFRRDNADDDHE